MDEIQEVDGRLLWLLRKAGEEWGPLGVALAAARLTDPKVLIAALEADEEGRTLEPTSG